MYAIIADSGHQYKVEEGQELIVDYRDVPTGKDVVFDRVLAVRGTNSGESSQGEVQLGTPTVAGAKVTAEVIEHAKDKKVVVFKYKPKTRYRRRTGHRQQYTDLKVTRISYRRTKKKETDGS